MIEREPLAYWVGLWLIVSLKCCIVYAMAGAICALWLRHRPAWRAMIWLLTIASFGWLSVLEWAADSAKPVSMYIMRLPDPTLAAVGHAYAVIAIILLGLVVHSAIRLRLLRSYASPLDIPLTIHQESSEVHEPRLIHQVGLYASGQIFAPTSFGVLTPTIIVPHSFTGTIYRHFIRAAVIHEFIAVLRFDALWMLLARLVQCLYFAHPVAWLAFRHYCSAREQVCDRWTVRTTGAAAEYEHYLVALAEPAKRIGPMSLDIPISRGGKSAAHRRIANLQGDDQPQWLTIRTATLVMVAWMTVLAGLAGIEWPLTGGWTGPTWHSHPTLMGVTAAAVVGVGLTAVAIVAHGRRPRMIPPLDGLAGQSRQTLADCLHWLAREWEDVGPALSLTVRRLEPVLLVALLLAATMAMWFIAGALKTSDRDSKRIVPETAIHESRWY